MSEAPVARPGSPMELFRVFTQLALQGFGGVLPVSQRVLVEHRRWLTHAEFLELMSLGQVLPGPNIVNMALIFGDRHFGWRGAAASLAGLIVMPLGVVLLLTVVARQASGYPQVGGALRGMGMVAAGMILSTAIKATVTLKGNAMGMAWCGAFIALTVIAVGVLRWPMAAVLFVLGPLAWFVAYRALRP